jgi:hypothetical protein
MPLSPSNSPRILKHTRAVSVAAYVRDDGLWDLDAHLTDIKTSNAKLASGVRHAGSPMHDLFLRVTINTELTVVDAFVVSDAVPYPGFCDTIGPDYKKLVGLNLMRGFRLGLKDRLSGVAGCTHLTELAVMLPTAAIQAFAGEILDTHDAASDAEQKHKPFQLDRCHALRSDGAAVAKYYPRWVTGTEKSASS